MVDMGWINYLIIPSWKIAIEMTRHVDELEDYIEEALDEILEMEDIEYMDEVKVKDLTISDLAELYNSHQILSKLVTIDDAIVFLLYFLKKRGIEYEIVSEFEFDKNKYKGFKIVEWE